jgi:hypothetical protein
MDSRIMDVLGDRVLELGPKPESKLETGPYRHFKLTRDSDGIAWLLFDREGASANTLSADVMAEFNTVLAALESQRPTGLVIARRRQPVSSPVPMSTSFAARPIRRPSRPRSARPMR